MTRKVAPALVAVVIALLVGACDEGETTDTGPREFGKSSGIERVPVPKEAKRAESLFDDENQKSFEVPGYTYEELRDWYSREMPDGIDWYRWQWCDLGGGPTTGETLIYSQEPRRILAVSIVKDTTPGIVIGTDNSGPC